MHLHVATPEPPAHGPGHKHRARRLSGKFLALYLLISGLLAAAVLVAPQSHEKAGAVGNGRDITWDVNGGLTAYRAMITSVREQAAAGQVPENEALRDEALRDSGPRAEHVFAVGLRAGETPRTPRASRTSRTSRAPLVSLLVRARDLAVVGYRLTTAQGHDSFFCFRGTESGDAPDELRFGGGYDDLERVGGRSRAGLVIDERLMTRSFTALRDDADEASTARALLVFTMTVSEAARFDALEQAFQTVFDDGSHTVSRAEAELMNSL
ncbi:ribosome-inactivating family protein [Streptomyces sp. NPDC046862]|uniref:ribosome-inactivating family protein n=1 Tax=Streptomyces sp. NPDC046862 TaxID=3154603 RepID=UPI003453B279